MPSPTDLLDRWRAAFLQVVQQPEAAAPFAVVEQHEREFIEPKGDAIRAFLPKDRPVLILMDEIISYVSTYHHKGYGDRLYNFIDALGETARGERNVVLVASVPASELEYTAADHADESRFKKMLDRLGKAIMMSAETEIAEIIRRRLFEWDGLPTDADKTAREYADWVQGNAGSLSGLEPESAYAQFRASYPFHPAVLSVFQRKWQALPAPSAEWSASSGSIKADGLFTAGDTPGLHAVRAKASGLEASAEVRLRAEQASEDETSTDEAGGQRRGPKSIRWSGTVPPQKWMNFYTKVLSRFAAVPGLQLEVRFEVPADDDQGRTKADEARGGLRELGLDDAVDLS